MTQQITSEQESTATGNFSTAARRHQLALRLAALGAVLLFAAYQTIYVIRTGDVAVHTRFGKPLHALTEPGLYFKLPWPIDQMHVFDGRLRAQEHAVEETYTADQQNIIVQTYAYWRIADPELFLQRIGATTLADTALENLTRNYKNMVIGRYTFRDFINIETTARRFEEIEQEIAAPVILEARQRYGIEVVMLGIHRLGLPDAVVERVFERMRAERRMVADRFRAEGEREAAQIRAAAEEERETILVKAETNAARLMAEGDAEAAEHYAVFETHPELAVFLRKLDVLESSLREKTTVILGAETAPYDLLTGDAAAIK